MEEFSDAVAAKGFVDSEGWGECTCHVRYMRSDITIQGSGFYCWLEGFVVWGGSYLGGWLVLDIRGHSQRVHDRYRQRYRRGKFR